MVTTICCCLILYAKLTSDSTTIFYIWGTAGCGKSHLLRALSNQYLNEQRAAIYVPLNKSRYFSPAVLENLEQQALVCLDDLDSVMGNPDWEIAIFDLFNRIKASGQTLLLVSASFSPSALNVQLPDLASRLKWGEIYQLPPLTDEQKLEVLQKMPTNVVLSYPLKLHNFYSNV
ncbi:chromosomal replication control, initiator (DnaA)/regulator (Hda) [Rodentibacter pneumotropicus]|uniref:Chromosomal replication control, initiator (DnaA)/regulator (Hda) n=1 Tax=Rodentibacter pneumotropicus TaxID=758 RepID=A0A448MSL9_9PAST|nr:chromosomal replication control, initiator (DnaA)/regulator (Hda) [Rodentibacter pneumotropicus]